MATELVAAAFGPTATLYDALQCDKRADPSQLKKAYRRQALKFHPDKAAAHSARVAAVKNNHSHVINAADEIKAHASDDRSRKHQHSVADSTVTMQDTTLKFQAVSAAYSILMDPQRRKLYDATGQVFDDNIDDDDDDGLDGNQRHEQFRHRNVNRKMNQQHWDEFFQSVFKK